MKHSTYSITTNYVGLLIELLEESGHDGQQLLRGHAIKPAALSDYFHRTSLSVFMALVDKAIEITADPGLGLLFGKRLTMSSHGMVGVAASNQRTWLDALQTFAHFYQLRSNFTFLAIAPLGVQYKLTMTCVAMPEFFYLFNAESFLSAVNNVILQRGTHGVTAQVDYPRPAWHKRYAEHIAVPVKFGAEDKSFVFPQHLMQQKPQDSNPALSALALQQCHEELKLREANYVEWVSHLIRSTGSDKVSREMIARQLHVSPSTLNRRLAEEGTHFKALLKQVRLHDAAQYLQHTQMSVAQIAQLLGYEDTSNFGRAFRAFYGCAPSVFRNSN